MKRAVVTELIPSSSRKSFYGRAKVIEQGGSRYLLSYRTVVGSVDGKGKVHRYWDGKSNTTSAHIVSFLKQFADRPMTSREFYSVPCEKSPEVVVTVV